MMSLRLRFLRISTPLHVGFLALLFGGMAVADDGKAPSESSKHDRSEVSKSSRRTSNEAKPLTVNVLSGLRKGQLSVDAVGRADGRITLSIKNRTQKKLRVVLPPGLIASGASGQFGGMGGNGGGMGGAMGGMNGGMGRGMGGQGGGMGGQGGGMGGQSSIRMMTGTVPPPMGMMMLGSTHHVSRRRRAPPGTCGLTIGGLSGGMGMGGMNGGGAGGMNGGVGGGMNAGNGPGFRSVPATGLPEALINPGEVRRLPTTVVSLDALWRVEQWRPLAKVRSYLSGM